ncbi:MAG: hypothetical protein AB7E32_13180 [Desulfovibrio sp.]
MKNTPANPATRRGHARPFLGLGHPLADVRRYAARLRCWSVRSQVRVLRRHDPPLLRHVSGYGLLVALNREIRGR